MAITEILFWWYKSGWNVFIHKNRNWLSSITDFFSMGSLIRTLFKPFRQISAETAGADSSLDKKFQMFMDRLVSRFIGFFMRLILLCLGAFVIIIGGIISFALILSWPFIPLLPVVGIILTVAGVTL